MKSMKPLPNGWPKELNRIKKAVHKATKLKFEEYTTPSQKQELCDARMLFAYQCRKRELTYYQIAEYLNRVGTVARRIVKKYHDCFDYDPVFRGKAEKVDELLDKQK